MVNKLLCVHNKNNNKNNNNIQTWQKNGKMKIFYIFAVKQHFVKKKLGGLLILYIISVIVKTIYLYCTRV